MQFQYIATASAGQPQSGVIEAVNLAEARRLLRTRGLFPTQLSGGEPNSSAVTAKRSPVSARRSFRRGASAKELLMITSQLSVMTRSGLDFADALQSVARQCRTPRLAQVLQAVFDDVSAGKSVSRSMERHPQVFPPSYVAGIAAGEASGTLPTVLARLAELQRNQLRIRNAIVSTMMYPIVLSIVAAVVIVALILVVLPQFAQVFRDLGTPAPPLTALLLSFSEGVRENLLWTAAAIAGLGVAAWKFACSPLARAWADRLVVTLPGLRGATQNLFSGKAFLLMGAMLETGVPLLEALRLCQKSISNEAYRNLFITLETEVTSGRGIGNALADSSLMPPGAAEMVMTAERTGKLAFVFKSGGEFFEEEGERAVKQAVKLLEPIVIVIMGVLVAAVVLAVMLPLLDVSTMSS